MNWNPIAIGFVSAFALFGTGAAATGSSGGSAGGATFSFSEAPAAFDYRHDEIVRYAMRFVTGATEARFRLRVRPPVFADGGSPFIEPNSLTVGLEGPARRGLARTSYSHVACSSYNVSHGAD